MEASNEEGLHHVTSPSNPQARPGSCTRRPGRMASTPWSCVGGTASTDTSPSRRTWIKRQRGAEPEELTTTNFDHISLASYTPKTPVASTVALTLGEVGRGWEKEEEKGKKKGEEKGEEKQEVASLEFPSCSLQAKAYTEQQQAEKTGSIVSGPLANAGTDLDKGDSRVYFLHLEAWNGEEGNSRPVLPASWKL
ncbi:hypothetical protein EYF80_018792 [Liparis tanakae]|uniref:Uncharacterized protein n=1 Tax=Liparis tanakae TaxID=230148 RepID=A0A4Z2HYV9_9TELE|nr:hypothetical protein EYF80_018792 [Liparis tanakae]